MTRRRPALLLCLAALIAGCGGSGGGGADARDPGRAGGPRSPESVVVAWANDMRRGDIEAASALFAVPATVANLSPEARLETRGAVRAFNESLPCGSRVRRMVRHHGLIIATVELTDRPGADCGTGTGNTAQAAFEVRDGKIVRWLRVVGGDPPAEPADPGPAV